MHTWRLNSSLLSKSHLHQNRNAQQLLCSRRRTLTYGDTLNIHQAKLRISSVLLPYWSGRDTTLVSVAVAVLPRWLVNLISSFGDDLFELGGLNVALFLTTSHWKSSRELQPRVVPSSECFSDTASRDALPFSKCAHGGWSSFPISPDFSRSILQKCVW